MAHDLKGQIINGIYVKERDFSKPQGKGKSRYWICTCPICKKDFSVRSNHLLGEKAIKMCSSCSNTKIKDLTGQTFGLLTVNKMIPTEKYKRTLCSCDCICGTTNFIVQANHLVAGEIQSCGCLISTGEEKISNILKDNNVSFEKQKIFKECKDVNYLRFDFYLPEFNLAIEYNGIQHYFPIDFFGGQKKLLLTQKHDAIKKEYCKNNNIKYLTISYKENIEDVLMKNNIIKKR